jgi:hypothetical protein
MLVLRRTAAWVLGAFSRATGQNEAALRLTGAKRGFTQDFAMRVKIFLSSTLSLAPLAGLLLCGLALPGIQRVEAAGGAYAVDDVEVGAPGSCKVEAWVSFASNHDLIAATSPACVIDLIRPIELGAQLQRFRFDGEWGTGLVLKAKTNILPVETGKIGLGLSGGTAFDLLTGENSAVFLAVPATFQIVENFRVNLNAGWLWDRIQEQHFLTWGAGLEWGVAQKVTLIAELFGQGNSDPRYQAGIRFTPTKEFDIDLIYGRNITGEKANWITLGVNLRFDLLGR